MRRPSLLAPLALLVLLAAACRRDATPSGRDSTAALPPTVDSTAPAPAAAGGWDMASAGPALFVNGGGSPSALVVFPQYTDSTLDDTTTFPLAPVSGATVELFARAGRIGESQLPPALEAATAAGEGGDGCVAWPSARLTSGVAASWQIGFARGHATAIPLDSIEGMSRGDSASLAADVARIASQIPNDTAVAFTGLPFVVRTAYRLRPIAGVDAVVADVVRRIGQEANPREQHILLVAERPAGSRGAWRLGYYARSSGMEEEVESREVLGAVTLGSARTPTIVIAITYNDGGAYSLVQRADDGTWREKWSSAYTGC